MRDRDRARRLEPALDLGELPPLLTVPETATLLRTTAKGIYSMVERGQLPGVVKLGRRVLIRRDLLVEFLSASHAPSAER